MFLTKIAKNALYARFWGITPFLQPFKGKIANKKNSQGNFHLYRLNVPLPPRTERLGECAERGKTHFGEFQGY